jgi:hypothetical protein
MMNRRFLVTALTGAALLVMPAAANAEVYLTKRQAQADARRAATVRYGRAHYVATCRPQGLEAPRPGFIYRRWVCDWFDDYECAGTLRIIGKLGAGWFYHLPIHGQTCPAE